MEPTTSRWHRWNGRLVFAFVALLIVLPWGYALVPLTALVIALIGAAGLGSRLSRLDREDGLLCLVLLGFAAVWLWDVWRTGHWPQGAYVQGTAMPLWPILGAGLMGWLRCYPPAPLYWWRGICCGALAVGGIALVERLIFMHSRVGNGMNAIPFGNLALLLGFLSLLASLWWSTALRYAGRHRFQRWHVLAASAAGAGMLASLLSGSRGGWVAAPLLIGLSWLAWRRVAPSGRRWTHRYWLLLLGLLVLAALPPLGVTGRVAEAVTGLQDYWQGQALDGSVGLRLEMWKGGWQLFTMRPLTGWGEGKLQAAQDALVDQGILHQQVSNFEQLHSDIIDTAARRGIVGLVMLLALYGVPMLLFIRRLGHADSRVRVLAVAGLMIPVAFIMFGLTQSMLRDVRGLSGYMGLCIVCWAVLRGEEKASHLRGEP